MTDWPPVIVLLITYERTDVALTTIKGIKERVHYPNLGWHIADDASNGNHVGRLLDAIGPGYEVTVSNAEGHGVGRSMNLGMKKCLERADIWLHWEDDWVPNMTIELWPCVRLLQENAEIGMVRLGRLSEGLMGNVIHGGDRLWWRLDKSRDQWCWTGHAAVRHRRFYDAYGGYIEDDTPGHVEMVYQDKFNRTKGPDVVWPAWLRYDICDHIGDGYSFKEAMEDKKMTREQAAQKFAQMLDARKVPA